MIKEEISKRQAHLAVKHELTTDSVIAELSKIVHADPRKLFAEDGRMLHPKDWPDEMAGAVASLEVVEEFENDGDGEKKLIGYTKKLKLWDKNSGIDKAMKHLGLFEADNKQRAGALSELPREMVKAIADRLKQLNAEYGKSARLAR
jgi:phage terminase small subunit